MRLREPTTIEVVLGIGTYGFPLIALNDGEVPLVMHALHHEPAERLLVFRVDARCLNELVLDLGDGLVILSPEVNLQVSIKFSSSTWIPDYLP